MKSQSFVLSMCVAAGVVLFATHVNAQNSCIPPESGAQTTVAELRDVQGNVLVSDPTGMASASNGQRVKNKVRVTTTMKAGVLVAFDCGCNVLLKDNQRLDIDLPSSCPALLAAVANAAQDVALGALPAQAAGTAAPLIAGAVGTGAYLLYRNNRNVGPN